MLILVVLLLAGLQISETSGKLGPEGCELGWAHYKNNCYQAVSAHTHFDSAKAICIVKHSILASLWSDDERLFVTDLVQNLNAIKPSAWLGVGVAKNQWVWLDGSGLVQSLFRDVPEADSDYCSFLSPDGRVQFIYCDIPLSAFVCKKPLEIIYVPDTANMTSNTVYFEEESTETLFERLYPPILETVSLKRASPIHLATIEVSHETACAYRCYALDECKTFSISCKSRSKCNLWYCSLFSGLELV